MVDSEQLAVVLDTSTSNLFVNNHRNGCPKLASQLIVVHHFPKGMRAKMFFYFSFCVSGLVDSHTLISQTQ